MARPGCWRLLPAVAGPASQQSFAVTAGVIAKRNPSPDTEICVDVHGGASVVTRQRDGVTDRTVSERGTIWLSPARGPEAVIEMSDPLPAILHIYLPPSQFSPKSLGERS